MMLSGRMIPEKPVRATERLNKMQPHGFNKGDLDENCLCQCVWAIGLWTSSFHLEGPVARIHETVHIR